MISIWEQESFLPPQDIIIVGGGFVGLWSAFYLKKSNPKLRITLLERDVLPTGASTRNAGFACFGSLSELVADAAAMGTDDMLHIVEMRHKGVRRIEKYFGAIADFDLCGGYELFEKGTIDAEQLNTNIAYLNTLLKSVVKAKRTFKLVDDKISRFGLGNTEHLVENLLEGSLHPGKLLRGLMEMVRQMGVQILNGIDVLGFKKDGKKISLQTAFSADIHCSRLLLCTNALTNSLLPGIETVPARGQVLLTSPVKGLPWKGTFHSEEGFYYFRNLGNRVLLGGARHKAFDEERTGTLELSEPVQKELERYLADVVIPKFRGQYQIERRWAGIMGMGTTKMPAVERVEKNVYCAVRLGGMGVALAPVIGEKAATLILD